MFDTLMPTILDVQMDLALAGVVAQSTTSAATLKSSDKRSFWESHIYLDSGSEIDLIDIFPSRTVLH